MAELVLDSFAQTNSGVQQVVIEAKSPTWGRQMMIPNSESQIRNHSSADVDVIGHGVNKCTLPVSEQGTPCTTQVTPYDIPVSLGDTVLKCEANVEPVLGTIACEVSVGSVVSANTNIIPEIEVPVLSADSGSSVIFSDAQTVVSVSQSAYVLNSRDSDSSKKRKAIDCCDQRQAKRGTNPCFVNHTTPHEDLGTCIPNEIVGDKTSNDAVLSVGQAQFALPLYESLDPNAQPRLDEKIAITVRKCVQTASYTLVGKDSLPAMKRRCQAREKGKKNSLHLCSKCNLGFSQKTELMKHVAIQHRIGRPKRSIAPSQNGTLTCVTVRQTKKLVTKSGDVRQSWRNKASNKPRGETNVNGSGGFRKARVFFQCKECGDEFCCRQDFNVHTCRFDKHVSNLEKENGRYALKPKEQNGVAANASLNSSAINEEKPYKCIQCGAAYRQTNHLGLHVRTHSRSKVSHVHGLKRQGQVNCDLHTSVNEGRCDELKRDQVNPSVAPGFHNPIYLGESDLEKRFPGRPKGVKNSFYTCRECNSVFTRKQLLDKHAFERHGFKRYNCKKCYASFTKETALHHHIQNSNKKCLFRQSKAKQKQKFQRTLNCSHKEQKDSFQLAESVNSAIKEGEFPYACQECQEKFSDKQTFTTHSCQNQMPLNDLGSELKRNVIQSKIPDSTAACQKNNPLTHCPLDTKEVHVCEGGGSSSVSEDILEQRSRTAICQQFKAIVNDASVTNSSNCSNNITSKTHASRSNVNLQLTSETSTILTDESVEPAVAVDTQNIVPLIDSPILSSHVVSKNVSNVSNEVVDETSCTENTTHQTEEPVGAHEFSTPDLSSNSVQLITSKNCEPVSECSVEQDDVITSITPINIYVCDECGAKFSRRIALLGHCRSHKRNGRRVSVELVRDHTSMLSSACNVAGEEPLHEPITDLVIPNTNFSSLKKLSEFNCNAKDPHQVTVHNDVPLQNDAYEDPLQNNAHEETLQTNAHKLSLQNDVSGKLVDKADEITDTHELVEQPPCNRNHDSISPNAETEFDSSNLSNNTVESIVACSLAPALASISDCGAQRRRPGRPKGSKNGMYTCRECNSVFRKKFRLKNHLVRDGVGGYTCSGNLQRIALNCHTSKEDQKETTELEKSHLTECHVSPNKVFGKLCYADFVQEVSSYKCQDCSTNFSYKYELALHACLQRGPVGDPSLQQNGATPSDTVIIKRGQLSSSIKSKFAHKEKPYKCNQCGATFVFKKNLQRHCLMYKCSNRGTTVDSKLNATLTQTNDRAGALLEQRLYKCGVCQLRFTTYPRLTAHLRSKRHRLFRPHVNRHEMRHQHNYKSCGTKFSPQSDLSSPSLTQSQSPSLVNTISEKARGETAVNSDHIDLDFKTGKEKDDDLASQDVVAEDWWNAPCHFSEAQTAGNVSLEKRLHSFGIQTLIASEDIKCTADLAQDDDNCSDETHSVSVLRQSDISIPKVNDISGDLIDSDVAVDPVASPLNELVNPLTEPGFKWFDLFSDAAFEPPYRDDTAPTEYSVSAFEESSDWPQKIIHLHTCEHCEHSLWNHTRSQQKDDAKGEIVTETSKTSDIVTDLFCDVPTSPTRKLFSSVEHGNISPILQGESDEPMKTDILVAKCVSVDKKKLKTGRNRKYKKLKCKFCDAKFTIKIALYNHTRIHKKNGVLHQPGYTAQPSTISNMYETVVNDQQSTATCHLANTNRRSGIINGKLPSKMIEPVAHKCWTSPSELKLVTRRRGRPTKHPKSYINCSAKGSLKNHYHICQQNDVQSNTGTRSIPLDGPTCERDVQSTKPNCVTSIGIPVAYDDDLTSNSTSVCVPNLKTKRELVDLYACNLCGGKFAGKLSLQSHVGIHKVNGHFNKLEAAHSPSDIQEGVKDQPCELKTQQTQLDDLTELIQPVTTDSEPMFNETSVPEHSLRKRSAGDSKNCSSTNSYCGDECVLDTSVMNRPCIPKPVEAAGVSSTNTHEIVADDQPINPTDKLVILNATPGSSRSIRSDEVSLVNCASVSQGNLKLHGPKKNNKRVLPYRCNHCSKQFTVKIAAWNHCRTLKAREVSALGAVVEETCSTSDDTFSYSQSTQLVQNTER